MDRFAETLLSSAKALPEGGLLFPKGFLHLASRAMVDQVFARLTREGKLLRVSLDVYTSPVSSRFGVRSPSTISIIESIESVSGEIVVPHGAAEANALGLTTQVPIREVFLTSGRSRKLYLGNCVVELKHADHWQLMLGKRSAGMAIRALFWLGPEQIPAALEILRAKLPPSEWIAMRSAMATLPSWMARAVS